MKLTDLVAVVDGDQVTAGTLKVLFPKVSFPANGPDQTWIASNSVYPVTQKPFTNDQKSTAVDPYYENGAVYNNTVQDKTAEELAADAAAELAAVKSGRVSEAVLLFANKVAAGFIYQGSTYQIDDMTQSNMVATQSRFNKGTPNSHGGYWRNKDNVKVTLTDVEVQALFDTAFEYKAALIRNMHDLKDAIAAATTVAEVTAIDLDTNWPE